MTMSDTPAEGAQANAPPGEAGLPAALAGALPAAAGVVVGIDLVEVERIAQTVERFGPRFLERVFTPEELQEGRRRITWLAGRFAAKEACAKALGTGIGAAVAWRDMQVLRQPSGKPSLRLLGGAAARAAALGLGPMDLSISHTHQYAIAIVVALTAHAAAGPGERPAGAAE
jgi:holo-[acyl-carrier protein] synthase